MPEQDTERVISAITIEQLRGAMSQSVWIARAMVADISESQVDGRSYAAHGSTPAKALFRLKQAVMEGEEGWSW